jgi:hypothetical protein
MKKVFSIALAIALAFSVVAPVATSAQSMTYAFNTNLTMGSRGADVVMLQSFLESKGLITIPAGVAKGYFGALTRSAVSAYQISKGITPAAGYFGPLTRASANADGSSMTTTTTNVAGCPAGAMFNYMTGASCATTTTTTLTNTGVEGNLDVRLAAAPANNANIQTSTDIAVYGIEFKARLADVSVQTMDLEVSTLLSSSAENPGTLINTIKVWDGSTVIATLPVNTSTFTKDSNNVYYVRVSGLNFIVPKDVTKVLTVSFSTNSIDSDRTVTIDGYGSSSIRAVSGNGISSFYTIDSLTRTHTFKKPGTASLTLSAASSPLRSQNYRINPDNGVQYMPVLTFNVKSETGDSKIQNVYASTTWSGTAPTTLYLYDGSTLLASKNVVTSGASINFDNLQVVVSKDAIKTLTVKADLPSSATTGSFSSTTVSRVVFEKPNGSNSDATGSQVYGVNQYAYTKAAAITLASAPVITVSNPGTTNGTTTMTATFTLNVAALGGNVVIPGNTGAEFVVVFSNGTAYTATSKSVVTIPNNDIADGSSATVTVTASMNPSVALTSGLYNAAITSIGWNAGNGTTTQTYGLDDFKTSSAVQFNR